MKDIVDDQCEYDEQRSITHNEFTPPQFLYVGCGKRGINQVKRGLLPFKTQSDAKHPPETVVNKVAFASRYEAKPGESDSIDRYIDDLEKFYHLGTEADCCFITADLDDQSALTDVIAISEMIQDSTIIALLTMRKDSNENIAHQLHELVGKTILIRDEDTNLEVIESFPGTGDSNADKLVQRLITDFITLITGNNLVGIDYARVWTQWDGGGRGIPFGGQLNHREIKEQIKSPTISFFGQEKTSTIDWFGYAWLDQSVSLAEFEYLQE